VKTLELTSAGHSTYIIRLSVSTVAPSKLVKTFLFSQHRRSTLTVLQQCALLLVLIELLTYLLTQMLLKKDVKRRKWRYLKTY